MYKISWINITKNLKTIILNVPEISYDIIYVKQLSKQINYKANV